MGVNITLSAPGGEAWFGQNWKETIFAELHAAADELGQLEQFNVSARTPVDTGALMADVSYEAYPDGRILVDIYADDVEQMSQWNRFYALYQEGGALGLSTYTNAPHEMFAKIMTDDIPAIQAWGEKAVQNGVARLRSGTGVKI